MSDIKRVLNWRPSPDDDRDFAVSDMKSFRAARKAVLPAKFSLRDQDVPIRDQGQTGECTGQAVTGAAGFLSKKTMGDNWTQKSVKFAYYNGRRMMVPPQTGIDSGCYIRTVIKAGARYGLCSEGFWPEESSFSAKPSVAAYADGTRFQLLEYGRADAYTREGTLTNIRQSLVAGLPVCFGFDVYSSFMTAAVASSGVAPIPKKNESVEGGHAVEAIGYDDEACVLKVRNSWGLEWGDKGYFTLPYWFVLNGKAADFWTISGQENGETAAGWFSGLPGYLFTHKEKGGAI